MEKVRVYEIATCKMVSSKCAMFGEGKLEQFDEWFSKFPRPMFPKDFLSFDGDKGGFVWYYIYNKEMNLPETFELVDFKGGLYGVATGIDGEDSSEIIKVVQDFIQQSEVFEEDHTRVYLGNIPTSPSAHLALGYRQMDYYVPIKVK